jgi:hypothetical protein
MAHSTHRFHTGKGVLPPHTLHAIVVFLFSDTKDFVTARSKDEATDDDGNEHCDCDESLDDSH